MPFLGSDNMCADDTETAKATRSICERRAMQPASASKKASKERTRQDRVYEFKWHQPQATITMAPQTHSIGYPHQKLRQPDQIDNLQFSPPRLLFSFQKLHTYSATWTGSATIRPLEYWPPSPASRQSGPSAPPSLGVDPTRSRRWVLSHIHVTPASQRREAARPQAGSHDLNKVFRNQDIQGRGRTPLHQPRCRPLQPVSKGPWSLSSWPLPAYLTAKPAGYVRAILNGKLSRLFLLLSFWRTSTICLDCHTGAAANRRFIISLGPPMIHLQR